jgi:hypothetical protein
VATRWSTSEDQLLRGPYADQLPVEQIAGRLARSPDAVVARRQALGIAPRRPSRPWSPREEAQLRAGSATGVPSPLLAQRLGRSTKASPRRAPHARDPTASSAPVPKLLRLHHALNPARLAELLGAPLRRRPVPTVMCAGTTRQRSALPHHPVSRPRRLAVSQAGLPDREPCWRSRSPMPSFELPRAGSSPVRGAHPRRGSARRSKSRSSVGATLPPWRGGDS